MTLLTILTLITFFGYNLVVHWYIFTGLGSTGRLFPKVFLASVINLIIFSGFILTPIGGYYEAVAMALYLAAIYLLIRKLYGVLHHNALFIALSFAVNLFAIRMLVRDVYLLNSSISLFESYSQITHIMLISLISFAIPIPYILVISYFIKKDIIDLIMIDRKNLIFSNSIMLSVFVYQLLSFLFVIPRTNSTATSIIGIFVSISSIAVYLITLLYTKLFADLQLNVVQFEKLSEVVAVEERAIRELKETATTDSLTGLKQRSVAKEVVALYLERKSGFFTVLFDIDGLKTANDVYGHDEGDFYIKKVAKILSSYFSEETVARIGGDEFLVVGNSDDEFICMKKVVACHRKIKNIQRDYKKPYNTSVSYGIVIVHEGITVYSSFEDIYRLADKRMYSFKKSNKKERRN